MRRFVLLLLFLLPGLCHSEKALYSFEEYSIPREIEVEDFFELENGNIFLYNDGSSFLSTDSGNSWTNVTQSNSNTLWGFATDSKNQVYLSAGDFVLHSSDAGQTWEQLLTEFPPYSYNQFVLPDGRLGYRDGKNICIFKKTAGTTKVYSVTFDISNVRLLPNGGLIALDTSSTVWKCDQLGGEWTQGPKIDNYHLDYDIPIAIGSSGRLALQLGSSVFGSNDYGLTWQKIVERKSTNFVLRFAKDGSLDALSTSDTLITKYSFTGPSWQPVDSTKLPMYTRTFFTAGNGDLYAASFTKELYCLRKGSAEWTKLHNGLPVKSYYYVEAAANKVVVHNSMKDLIEFSSPDAPKQVFPARGCRNYRILSPNADTIVAEYNDSLFCSRDGGQSWARAAGPIGQYYEFKIANNFSGRYYRITNTEILWTTDCGRNWKMTPYHPGDNAEVVSVCILASGRLAICNSFSGTRCFDPSTESFTIIDTSLKNALCMADVGNDELLINIDYTIYKYNIKTKQKTKCLSLYTAVAPGLQAFGSTWYIFSRKVSYFSCDSGKTWRPLPTPNTGRQVTASIAPDGSVYSNGNYGLFKLTPNEGSFEVKSMTPDSVQFIGKDFSARIEHKGIPSNGDYQIYYYGGIYRILKNEATIKDLVREDIGNGTSSINFTGTFNRRKMLIICDQSYPLIQVNSDKKYLAILPEAIYYVRARDIMGDDYACNGQMFELNAMNLFFNEIPLLWMVDSSTSLFTFHDSPIARLAVFDTGYHCLKLIGYSDTLRLYSDTVEKWIYIRNIPDKPTITRLNDTTIIANEGYEKYQWYLFTQPIEGATSRVFQSSQILEGGFYTVTVEDSMGCISPFSDEYYNPAEDYLPGIRDQIIAQPNPASSATTIRFNAPTAGPATISITSIAGIALLRVVKELPSPGVQNLQIDLSELAGGLYFVSVKLGAETYRTKLIIER